MAYTVRFARDAAKQIGKLPKKARERLLAKITRLADDPRPPGCLKLTDAQGLHRIRSGDYRVVYSIRDAELIVTVVRVADRNDAYD